MFITNSLCLILCPIHEWRQFFKIVKSNLSSFALWKNFIIRYSKAKIYGLHFLLCLYSISWWNVSPCSLETASIATAKKKFNGGCRKWSVSDMLHTSALHAEISYCIIWLLFSSFSLSRRFLHTIKCLSGSSFCGIQVCTKVSVFEQLFNLWTN